MRTPIILLITSTLVACASVKKQPDAAKPTPDAQPTQASTKAAQKIDADVVKEEVCESGQDKRLLEVRKKTSGCELSYTKFGKSKVVSSGKYGLKHCEDSLDKIMKKLEVQKFSCNPA